jgi:hypothetical protein
LLNTSANSWYSGGIPSISLAAMEVGVVLSEDILRWKVSESSSLQMRAKAAAFTRAIYGAFNFGGVGGSTGGEKGKVGGGVVLLFFEAMRGKFILLRPKKIFLYVAIPSFHSVLLTPLHYRPDTQFKLHSFTVRKV